VWIGKEPSSTVVAAVAISSSSSNRCWILVIVVDSAVSFLFLDFFGVVPVAHHEKIAHIFFWDSPANRNIQNNQIARLGVNAHEALHLAASFLPGLLLPLMMAIIEERRYNNKQKEKTNKRLFFDPKRSVLFYISLLLLNHYYFYYYSRVLLSPVWLDQYIACKLHQCLVKSRHLIEYRRIEIFIQLLQ
jgi:hypothetical protein